MKNACLILGFVALAFFSGGSARARLLTDKGYSPGFLRAKQAEFYGSLTSEEKKIYQDFKNNVGVLVLNDSAQVKKLGFKITRSYNFAGNKWYELPHQLNNDAVVDYLGAKGINAYNLEYAIIKTQDRFSDSIPSYLPYPEKKWGLKTIGFLDQSVSGFRTFDGEEAKNTIFVLDTGGPCDSLGAVDHPYFQARGKIRMGGNHVPRPDSSYFHWDWTFPPRDRHGHGTHVGGIIADLNRSDSLVFVKMLSAGGFGLFVWSQEAIQEAVDYGIATGRPVLVNGSWGGGPWAPIEYQFKYIDSLVTRGLLRISFVFAAGNTSSQFVTWPAAYGHRGFIPGHEEGYPSFIISVGAIQLTEKGSVVKAPYSAYDRDVDIFAPGGGLAVHDSALSASDGKYYRFDSGAILSAAPMVPDYLDWYPRYYRDWRDSSTVDPLYRYLSGTSMAAPHITGAIACFLRRYSDFPIPQLRERLRNTGKSFTFLGSDSVFSYEGKYLYLPYFWGIRLNVRIISYTPPSLKEEVGVGAAILFRLDSVVTKNSEPLKFRWTFNNAVVGNEKFLKAVFWDPGWHKITGFVLAGEEMDFVSWLVFVNPLVGIESDNSRIPKFFALHQNYPNPFNPSTTIKYDLPKQELVKLTVYDLLGREIMVLADGLQPAGFYQVVLEGGGLTSGVYFYRLEAGSFIATRKFILLK